MSEPFIAEIRIFAGNFAPRGWAFCDGQLLPISENTALFSLIGTTYGGDGRTTTALPNLEGRAPMGAGRGPGLTARQLGERGGTQMVGLTTNQIPSHSHQLYGTGEDASASSPASNLLPAGEIEGYTSSTNLAPMDSNALETSGGSQPHNNISPILALNFIIALVGLYPSRS